MTDRLQPWALATLVRTRGSTYRKPGARLLVDARGDTLGVLSGGCLEEEIGWRGQRVIQSGVPELVTFDTRRIYGCDGYLEVLIERVPAAEKIGNFLTRLGEKLFRREKCRVRTDFEGDVRGSDLLPADAIVIEQPGTLIHFISPPIRLLVFGEGPEVGPIQAFASDLGWIAEQLLHPTELSDDFVFDDQTVALVMTHNFGRDLAALDRLIPARLPYVGLLGPRKRHAELLSQFQNYRELLPLWIRNVYAPAGLDIGSEAPEEIALSIVSEVATVLAKRPGGFLRDRPRPIHADEPMTAAGIHACDVSISS